MNKIAYIAAITVGLLALCAPLAFASTTSASIAALSPGPSVIANNRLTFIITAAGFTPESYQLSDSFTNSSASASNISGAGNFFWAPLTSDVGTHVLTITAQDGYGDSAVATQTITVLPVPSLSISAVSPGTIIMPGTKFSFTVSQSELVSPSYSISDAFSGSSVTDADLDASGNFSWTPDLSQNGNHVITIYAYDSAGHSASITQAVQVGVGPTLMIILLSPGAQVPFGTTTSFTATPNNFAPTSFSVSDSFTGSTVSNNNITTAGAFSWMPQQSDVGVHLLTVKGVVGTFGQSTTTTQKITVVGTNGTAVPAPVSLPTTIVAPTATVSTAPVNTSATGDGYVFNNFMGYGEDATDGPDVLELQKRLTVLKFFAVAPTGYFGAVTQLSVKKFQTAQHIAATGFVGSLTRAALNK